MLVLVLLMTTGAVPVDIMVELPPATGYGAMDEDVEYAAAEDIIVDVVTAAALDVYVGGAEPHVPVGTCGWPSKDVSRIQRSLAERVDAPSVNSIAV